MYEQGLSPDFSSVQAKFEFVMVTQVGGQEPWILLGRGGRAQLGKGACSRTASMAGFHPLLFFLGLFLFVCTETKTHFQLLL